VTRSFDPVHSRPAAGLFRPADHVLVVPQGSAVTILDLERGVMYATTPFGAAAWSTLVGSARPPHRAVAKRRRRSDAGDGRDAWARIAGYLFDRHIIEPIARGEGELPGRISQPIEGHHPPALHLLQADRAGEQLEPRRRERLIQPAAERNRTQRRVSQAEVEVVPPR